MNNGVNYKLSIQELIKEKAGRFGSNIAFQILSKSRKYRTYTYTNVLEKALAVAAFLADEGIAEGECIGIYAPNSPEWAICCLGILLARCVVVPMDTKSGPIELNHMITDGAVKYVFVLDELSFHLNPLSLKKRIIFCRDGGKAASKDDNEVCLQTIFAAKKNKFKTSRVKPEDPAVIIYTSGTTKEPKGVVLTNRSILFDINAILSRFDVDEHDNFLSVIVLSHAYEFCCGLLLPFFIGAKITYSRDIKYTTILNNMKLANPTVMYGVPRLFNLLLDAVRERIHEKNILESGSGIGQDKPVVDHEVREKAKMILGGKIRYFVSGGAPLFRGLVEEFSELGVELLQVYGLTECSPVLTMTDGNTPPGSVGRPLPGVEIRIEPDGDAGSGEICARGPNLMKGYHNNPEGTKEAVRDGWLYTGDIGNMDEKDNLFITGRRKSVIVTSAGVNVFPEELEERIGESPFVKEVCVVGKQSPDRTETVYAVIVVDRDYCDRFLDKVKSEGNKSVTLNQIIRKEITGRTHDLAYYKAVADFQIRNTALPRTRTGKILRNEVKHQAFSVSGRLQKRMAASKVKPLLLVNGTIITPFRLSEGDCILIEGGKISQLGEESAIYLPPDTEVIDLKGGIVTPGFIDLHVHGGSGFGFNDANPAQYGKIEDFFIRHGTTRLVPTLYLDEKEKMLATMKAMRDYAEGNPQQSIIAGIHLEGPFINRRMCGALNPDYIWEPGIDAWLLLYKYGGNFIKLMTIAPEVPGALDVMQAAAQEGVVLSIAHSIARYEDIEIAIDNGLSQVTHIFNAMKPMHHREPGVLVGALLKRELKVQLIADGVHVHPAVMELLYRIKGADGIILITDAITASGMDNCTFDMGGLDVTVKDGKAFLPDNTLAGSTLTMETAVKVMVEKVGVPVTEAVRMASLNPARVLGLDHKKGVLAVGKDADMVVLDRQFNVRMTIIGGVIRYRRENLSG
ncbi:MAG: N-acetylglucosamine-6-phosphate deacetylase [Spirochaetales bacterium]|nr:N-acetylglucosamine-6-phosphate deacetylase [Spirochaetales bacterium]